MTNPSPKKEGGYASLTGFRRAVPIILTAFAVFIGLCFIMQDTGALGKVISSVLLGLFSIGGYFIPAFLVLHAIFYASDVQKKRTLSRVVFTLIAVITISSLVHTITYFKDDPFFSAKDFYVDGTHSEGGGFVGGLIAFILRKLFGRVGPIIIAITLFAIYFVYFFAGGKSVFSRLLLKILTAISNFFGAIGKKDKDGKKKDETDKKKDKPEKKDKREEKRIQEAKAVQDELCDDEFFEADNGMKELTIKKLGINEVREEAETERNPHLHDKVFHKSDEKNYSVTDSYKAEEAPRPEPKRRAVNMDYSTTDSLHGFSVSVTDSKYTPKENDIIYEKPISRDRNAEDVFVNGFDPFDVKMNEQLSSKPSSKTVEIPKEDDGITEVATPINEVSHEDVEKARQRADFEMKKRAAIEAQNKYAAAQAEIERANREREARQRAALYGSEAYADIPTANEDSEPYIPEYMRREEKPVQESTPAAPSPQNAESYRRAATFASAISDYEKQREEDFRPYEAHVESEENAIETAKEGEACEEIKITRSMLDPNPVKIEKIDIPEESDYEVKDTHAFDSKMEFDFTSSDDEDNTEDEEDDAFNTSETTLDFDDDDENSEDIEIPLSEQNADVIAQRKMFSFLNDIDNNDKNADEEDDAPALDANGFYSAEELRMIEAENAADEDDKPFPKEEDRPPFELSPLAKLIPQEKPKPEPKPVQQDFTPPDYSDYQYPSVELLNKGKIEEDLNQEEEKNQNAEKLVDALLQFNVRISIKGIDRGPRITRYEIVPARGVKVNSVTNLFNDIALNLGVEGMRMEAPIPGKSAIGVEIPNKKPSTVLLRDLVESDEFICAESKTMSCLGKDVTGNPVFADIAKMPHVLVAGATGMGKSVCINSILISILYKARPDEVKFIMIDPKKVEFNGYNGIPHLLVPVVTDVKQAAGALMWAVEQMEKRYDLMEALEVRKLDSYNEKVREDPSLGEPLPKIIIVIDELNDIMLQVRKPAEDLIMSIAQKARAAGIHLIIGTQRPSVDVITGVIKANIPSRISCKVASYNDSKTILEQAGAEKLLNNGDMLYIPAGAPKALRVQGAFVSDGEVAAIMKFLKTQAKGAIYDAQALEEINRAAQKCSKGKGGDDFDDDDSDDGESAGVLNDQQFLDAVELAVKSGKISTSLIQRKISIGYGKAAKYIDIMEDMGIVSEPNGQKPRDVLVSKDEWHEMLSRRSLD